MGQKDAKRHRQSRERKGTVAANNRKQGKPIARLPWEKIDGNQRG